MILKLKVKQLEFCVWYFRDSERALLRRNDNAVVSTHDIVVLTTEIVKHD